MARGALPDSHPPHLGMPGMHGTVAAVTALQKADLLVTPRRPLRRPRHRPAVQLRRRTPRSIHADIDPAEIGKNRIADVPIVGDCQGGPRRPRRRRPAASTRPARAGDYAAWWRAGWTLARHLPARLRRAADGGLARPAARHRAASARSSGPESIYVAGVGQHQMWAAQFIQYERPNTWLNSGGLGTMGYAVPAAMGAKVGRAGPHRLGDRRRRLLPDDQPGAGHLRHQRHPDQGRDHQQLQPRHGPAVADAVLRRALLQHRPAHRSSARRVPDFVKLADAYGCVGLRCERPEDVDATIAQGHGDQRRPGRRRLRRAPRRDGVADGAGRASATTRSRSPAASAPVWDREE